MVIRFHYGNSFACGNFHQNHAGSLPVIEWFLLMNTGLNLTCTLSVFQKTPDFMGDLSILLDTGPMDPVVRGGSPTNHRRYPYTIHLLLWGAEMTKVNQKRLLNLVKVYIMTQRGSTIKQQQAAYDRLRNYCDTLGVDLGQALEQGREYLLRHDLAMAMNGYL